MIPQSLNLRNTNQAVLKNTTKKKIIKKKNSKTHPGWMAIPLQIPINTIRLFNIDTIGY